MVLPGSYCEVHDKPVPTNTMVSRTHEAITLGPAGNLQGSVKFFCLNTGRVLKRRRFTQMPMPQSVITKVNNIGKNKIRDGRSASSTAMGSHSNGLMKFRRTTRTSKGSLNWRLHSQTLTPRSQKWNSKNNRRHRHMLLITNQNLRLKSGLLPR